MHIIIYHHKYYEWEIHPDPKSITPEDVQLQLVLLASNGQWLRKCIKDHRKEGRHNHHTYVGIPESQITSIIEGEKHNNELKKAKIEVLKTQLTRGPEDIAIENQIELLSEEAHYVPDRADIAKVILTKGKDCILIRHGHPQHFVALYVHGEPDVEAELRQFFKMKEPPPEHLEHMKNHHEALEKIAKESSAAMAAATGQEEEEVK